MYGEKRFEELGRPYRLQSEVSVHCMPKQRTRLFKTVNTHLGVGVRCRRAGRSDQSKKRLTEGRRESDRFIVLGGWESHLQGEGTDGSTQPAKETSTGQAGSEQ